MIDLHFHWSWILIAVILIAGIGFFIKFSNDDGDPQLAWVFFNGMEYGRTGKIPKDLLDDEDFVSGSVNN